jgi:hypothetical protein
MSRQVDRIPAPKRRNFSRNANYRQSIRAEDLQLLQACPRMRGIHVPCNFSTQKQTAEPRNLSASDREHRDTFSICRCDVCKPDRISLRVGIFMAGILVRRSWKCLERGRTKHRPALSRATALICECPCLHSFAAVITGNETCCALSPALLPLPYSEAAEF